jgi:hypothetical protein
MKSDPDKLLKKNEQLNQLDLVKVISHVQREEGDEIDGWVVNTLMLEGHDVPFKYSRKRKYRSLKGAPVNVTYYAQTEQIAGMDFEVMKVVRIRKS